MALKHRLKELEKKLAPPIQDTCQSCGLPLPGARRSGPIEFTVGWWSPGDPEEPPCLACGQKTEFRIEFDKAR